jgi:molybdate transport system substrate-binding protein
MHRDVDGRIGRIGWVPLALCLLSLALSGCGTPPPAEPNRVVGTLTAQAPVAMREAIAAVATQFQTDYPGVKVQFAPQTASGAATSTPVSAPDVIITEAPLSAGAFAITQLVIAVATDNPRSIANVADLPRVRVALCAAGQPCGTISDSLLAGVSPPTAARVSDTRAGLAQVVAGEVDAALVYRTDARSAGDDVGMVELTPSAKVGFTAAVRPDAALPDVAATFVAFLSSAAARERLTAHGFQHPA